MTGTAFETDTAAAVLDFARDRRGVADRAEAELLQAAVDWAGMHSVDSIQDAATVWDRTYGDTGITVAGAGAPLIAEFSVAEFAAAIGLPTEAGKAYLGEAVELRYRLSAVWARVSAGDLQPWRARRIARATIMLNVEAAAFVDAHVAHVAHKIRLSQLDRLVEEAIARFMPEEVEKRRRAAADGRHFTINHHQVSLEGTSDVWGTLDLADALDLETALSARAAQLTDLGSAESLDVRRAIALGEIARHQLALDLNPSTDGASVVEEVAQQPSRNPRTHAGRRPRQVVLYLHLSDAAIGGEADINNHQIGRVENTRSMITTEQVRQWCGNPDAQITVKPLIDLNEHLHVDAYEVPDRMAEQAVLINHTCIFPWCTRPARACQPDEHDADCDHIKPYDSGGTTCSCNIAPLCRRHHRLKTHGAWNYTPLEHGTYLWTSPHGYQYLRDHEGTLDVSHDRRDQPPRP